MLHMRLFKMVLVFIEELYLVSNTLVHLLAFLTHPLPRRLPLLYCHQLDLIIWRINFKLLTFILTVSFLLCLLPQFLVLPLRQLVPIELILFRVLLIFVIFLSIFFQFPRLLSFIAMPFLLPSLAILLFLIFLIQQPELLARLTVLHIQLRSLPTPLISTIPIELIPLLHLV